MTKHFYNLNDSKEKAMTIQHKIRLYYAFKFLQNAHFFAAVLVPFFTIWAGMTEQTVLQIQSWFMLCVTILELPTGVIADGFGRKTSLVIGGIAATLGLIVYGLYANLYLFLLGETILALAMTCISGADEAWLIDTLNQHGDHKHKTEIIGKGQSFMFAGMIVSTIIGSWIASHISLNATMYLSAIPSFILILVASHMPEPTIHKAVKETFVWKQGFLSLKVLLLNPKLRRLTLNLILVAVPAYFVIWLYQPLSQLAGIDIVWFGAIHSTVVGLEIVVSHRFSWFEKQLGIAGYLKLGALLTTFGFLILLGKLNLFTILIFVLTAGSFGLTRRYFALKHFHELVSSTYRASLASAFSLLLRFSIAVANIVIGWLFVQSIPLTLLLLGLLPIVAVVFVPLNNVFDQDG